MNIAVITGASSGMGREFVRRMDESGFDEIWGVALEKDLLEKVKGECHTKFRVFDLDLTNDESLNIYKEALEEEKPNVTWLINCSGYGKFGRYDEIPLSSTLGMIDVNCRALVGITEITLNFMREGARIIEVSSLAAFQPTPYMNVYAASKAFVLSYARALNVELKSRKISVTCMCPFWTKTAFFKTAEDTETKEKVVTKYVAKYEPKDVVNKAIKDAMKRKELSICGSKARSQVRLVKMFSPKIVMRTWIKQQKLHKKYKDK